VLIIFDISSINASTHTNYLIRFLKNFADYRGERKNYTDLISRVNTSIHKIYSFLLPQRLFYIFHYIFHKVAKIRQKYLIHMLKENLI
jgi:hypothetical protein